MADQLVYRLNRVPDATTSKFLDLIGVALFPPTAAAHRRHVLAVGAAARQPSACAAGTEVATVRTETEEAVVFATERELDRACRCALAVRRAAGGPGRRPSTAPTQLAEAKDVLVLRRGAAARRLLLFGLSRRRARAARSSLRARQPVDGVGVDPRQPAAGAGRRGPATAGRRARSTATAPAASTGPARSSCTSPAATSLSRTGGQRAGWLRCRVAEPDAGQPFYTTSPDRAVRRGLHHRRHRPRRARRDGPRRGARRVHRAAGPAAAARPRAGRRRRPAAAARRPPSATAGRTGRSSAHFAASGPERPAHHPRRGHRRDRLRPGRPRTRRHAAAVRRGAAQGRGRPGPPLPHRRRPARQRGAAARVQVLRTSVPYVSEVVNREAARGGVDGETVEEAKLRAPITLRAQDRAVTLRDYEELARRAAPETARITCLEGEAERARRVRGAGAGRPAGGARPRRPAALRATACPGDALLARITRYLDERRLIGTRLAVGPPFYQGVTVVATVHAFRGRRHRPRPPPGPRRAVPPPRPADRRRGRHGLAVRPARAVRRGLRGAAARPGRGTGRRGRCCTPPTR